jgi:hypothetical protein
MKTKSMSMFIGAVATCATLSQSNAATIALFEAWVNIDSNVTDLLDLSPPSSVNLSGFDTATGLGTIRVTVTGVGSHFIDLFVDHEIDESSNTFFNEFGGAPGTPATGQSWEIDEPGYAFGNIYTHFAASALDNSIGVTVNAPDDVSMALGWDFNLAASETALASFSLGTTQPAAGFFLSHTDPDSQATIYFSSSIQVRSDGPNVPDGGWTLAMLGASVTLMGAAMRLKQSKIQQSIR